MGQLLLVNTGKMSLLEYLSGVYGAGIASYDDGTQNVDISSPNFDGFVIPNGTTFSCGPSEFSEACKVFSQSKQQTAT